MNAATLDAGTARDARFWDKIADGYAKNPVRDQRAYEKKLAITQEYFTPDSEVLELGCGTGSTAIAHAPHVKRIHAVDMSAAMLDIARGKADEAGVSNIDFEQASVEAFQAPAGSYDVVMGHSLLHLLADRETATAKIYDLLKPGGVFISNTVCLKGTPSYLRILYRVMIPAMRLVGRAPSVVSHVSPDDIMGEFGRAGFKTLRQWSPDKANMVLFAVVQKPA
ncbi:MAG: class I SAM-dependent methyltransferase [Pseudomonadota bacterium]